MNITKYDASTYEGRLEIYNAMMQAYKSGHKEEFWHLNELLPEVINDLMDLDLRLQIGRVIRLAEERGEEEVADRLGRILPMASFIVEVIKSNEGLEGLLSRGYNLAEAEAEHGRAWLQG